METEYCFCAKSLFNSPTFSNSKCKAKLLFFVFGVHTGDFSSIVLLGDIRDC